MIRVSSYNCSIIVKVLKIISMNYDFYSFTDLYVSVMYTDNTF